MLSQIPLYRPITSNSPDRVVTPPTKLPLKTHSSLRLNIKLKIEWRHVFVSLPLLLNQFVTQRTNSNLLLYYKASQWHPVSSRYRGMESENLPHHQQKVTTSLTTNKHRSQTIPRRHPQKTPPMYKETDGNITLMLPQITSTRNWTLSLPRFDHVRSPSLSRRMSHGPHDHVLSVCVWALLVYLGVDSLSKEEKVKSEVSRETCSRAHQPDDVVS